MARERRVLSNDGLGSLTGFVHERLVPDHFEQTQRRSLARLGCPEDVTLPARLKIDPGQCESVGGRSDGSEPLAGGRARFRGSDEQS